MPLSGSGNSQRRHYLSAASLISPGVNALKREVDGPRGKATYSYTRIADVVQRISSNPVADLKELYARMVLNVAVHNTDDHLQNTGFLKDEGSHRYRLAPIFDVVTQEGDGKHTLHIGVHGRESSFENALSEYRKRKFGLRSEQIALSIVETVREIVAQRQSYYEQAGLLAQEVAQIESALIAWHDNTNRPTHPKAKG